MLHERMRYEWRSLLHSTKYMQITRFVVNMIQENCYLAWDDTQEAVLIDCGAFHTEEKKAIQNFIEEHQLNLTHLFNTHGHFDHVFGAQFVHDTYGVDIELCADERETYEQAAQQMSQFLHLDYPLTLPPVGHFFKDGDVLKVGNMAFRVIETPGHTPGGVCFYEEKEHALFSGDSLFRHEIGRCDLPGGDEASLIHALKTRVLTLPDDVQVLPGHGPATTVGEERSLNYYLR